MLQLYKTLHPEDTEVTQDALTDITIHNILTDAIYNDLGFVVDDRLVVLVEAQSTLTIDEISQCSGLSSEEVEKLKKGLGQL